MPRPRKTVPAYSLHKPTGQAVVKLTLPGGGRKTVYLGRYDSPESRREYARVVASLADPPAAGPARTPSGDGFPDPTMNEVMLAFMRHAAVHYRRPDGTPTSEVGNFKAALRPVKALYGDLPARRFGPRELKAVRDRVVAGGCCRTEVNARVGRVRRVVKWAAGEGLVPVETHLALTVVTGLQRGRSAARESEPVRAVPEEVARAVLPHVLPPVQAMVELQLLTGMRLGEVCAMRPADVDTTGAVWVYRPGQHKLAHRGRTREVVLGPKAQAILQSFAPPDPKDYYFSPRRAVADQRAGRAAARKTPRYPSHVRANAGKRASSPASRLAAHYSVSSYGRAVARACDRVFPPLAPLARRPGETEAEWRARLAPAEREQLVAWWAAHRWHPNQLRHTFATAVRKAHGLEAAQVLLGHARADVTQVYAERDAGLALRVAAQVG